MENCNVDAIYKTNTNNNTILFYYIMINIEYINKTNFRLVEISLTFYLTWKYFYICAYKL